MLSGDNGILQRATDSKEKTTVAGEKEQIQLEVLGSYETNGNLLIGTVNANIKNHISGIITNEATQFPLTVTYTETGNTYIVDGNGNVEKKKPVTIPQGLQVGSIVTYEPIGSIYKWQGKYATTASLTITTDTNGNTIESTTDDVELNSKSGGNARITSWKVFKIEEEEGNIQLVPATVPTSRSTAKVRLQGAPGYNNGVKLLNDACSILYSYQNKEITARNINIEDLESVMDKTALETEKLKYTNANSSYNYLDNNNYVSTAYSTDKSYYPLIYEDENKSIIDEETNTNGLKCSQSPISFIERDGMGKKSGKTGITGKLQASTSIQPCQTYYYTSFQGNHSFSSLFDSVYQNILAPNNSSYYWVASRAVDVDDNACYFRIQIVQGYGQYNRYMTTSGSGESTTNSNAIALFPVVSLSSEFIEKDGDNFKVQL